MNTSTGKAQHIHEDILCFTGEGAMLALEGMISNWVCPITKKSPSNINQETTLYCLYIA